MTIAVAATVAVTLRIARLIPGDGCEWVHCCVCGKRLGEIVGDRVVVKMGDRTMSARLQSDTVLPCPKCGEPNVVPCSERNGRIAS